MNIHRGYICFRRGTKFLEGNAYLVNFVSCREYKYTLFWHPRRLIEVYGTVKRFERKGVENFFFQNLIFFHFYILSLKFTEIEFQKFYRKRLV